MTSEFLQRVSGFTTGLAIKAPCVVETTVNITLSGEQTINSVAVVAEDRVLVKDQTAGAENGIWVVKTTAWVRADDFNGSRDVTYGTLVPVAEGTLYEITTTGTITIGTTAITFATSNLSLAAAVNAINQLTPAADRGIYYTSATEAALFTLTAFARTLLDDADAAAALVTLGAQPDLDLPSQAEAEAGTETAERVWNAERINQAIQALSPISAYDPGDLKWSARASTPTGFLLCDGSAVSRETYEDLFTAIGTTWGVGDGSTTFNLPPGDIFPLASGGRAVGATGGSADAITVAHTHTVSGTAASGGSHSHTVPNSGVSGGGDGLSSNRGVGTLSTSTHSGHTHSVSGTAASTGSSGTDANLPPFATFNLFIKT